MSAEHLLSRDVYDSARRPHPFVEEVVELVRYRDLLFVWSVRNITLRYKRSVLGVVWTLLEPLILMTILTIVFSSLFRFRIANFPIYLLSGLLLFSFFSRSTSQMVEEIISSQSLAKRIYVPRSIFALAALISYFVNWCIALIPLVGIMLVLDAPISWSLLSVPAGMLMTAIFAFGIGLIVATVGAFFHDVQLMYSVLLTAWFYATPIFYPVEIVPDKYKVFLLSNPLFYLCSLVRDPVWIGEVASVEAWLMGGAFSLIAAGVGWWVFTHYRDAVDYTL